MDATGDLGLRKVVVELGCTPKTPTATGSPRPSWSDLGVGGAGWVGVNLFCKGVLKEKRELPAHGYARFIRLPDDLDCILQRCRGEPKRDIGLVTGGPVKGT